MRIPLFHGKFAKMRVKMVARSSTGTQQFKCRRCIKHQECYGSRYCQNPFDPTPIITHPSAAEQ